MLALASRNDASRSPGCQGWRQIAWGLRARRRPAGGDGKLGKKHGQRIEDEPLSGISATNN
jgi:hypothetical protein